MRPAPGAPPTRAQIQTEVSEVRPKASVITPNYRLTFGSLEYREMITAFERLDPKTGRRQSMHILSSRQRLSRTQGIWLHVPHHAPEVQTRMRTALHTVVHAVMAVLPVCLLISPDNIQGGGCMRSPTMDRPTSTHSLSIATWADRVPAVLCMKPVNRSLAPHCL